MIKLKTWLLEARAARDLLTRLRVEGANRVAQDAACREKLGFGLRAAQDRMAVARFLEYHAIPASAVKDVHPSKLRSLTRSKASTNRQAALHEVRHRQGLTSQQVADAARTKAAPALRTPVSAAIGLSAPRSYVVALATRRRGGQLVLSAEMPCGSLSEVATLLRGSAWMAGSVQVVALGLARRDVSDLRALLEKVSQGFQVRAYRDGSELLSAVAEPRARRRSSRPTRARSGGSHWLPFDVACALLGCHWPDEHAPTPLQSSAALGLAIGTRHAIRARAAQSTGRRARRP